MSPEASRDRPGRFLWTRLGLRARVTVMFALGALLLSTSMGCLSYFTVRHVLVGERESASLHQAFVNANSVREDLRTGADIEGALSVADSGTAGSHSVLNVRGTWYARTISFGREAIPSDLRALVGAKTAASQLYVFDGSPVIAVGVPVPSVKAAYYELFDVGDLAHTLRILALALFGAGLITTVLGAVVGRWASGRSLRPLTGVSRAAVAIAAGRLDTRLRATAGDPDLVGLTSSFNRMVDQLQERIERDARFTSDVSHELRSPLTTLSASLEVLEAHGASLSGSGRQALELLAADLRRFQRMVGELLEMSRSDSGSADVFLEEVDAGELVRRAVDAGTRSLPAGARPPPVLVEKAVAGARLAVDKRRFERVMTNLLENATYYGRGATAVRVELGPQLDEDRAMVRIAVEDRGPGLPPAERTKVFERFYRGQASGQRGSGTGTGLGLALVAEHVRLQGGTVWAEERQGGGARFVVELPRSPPTPEAAGQEPEPVAQGTEAGGQGTEAGGQEPEPAAQGGGDNRPRRRRGRVDAEIGREGSETRS